MRLKFQKAEKQEIPKHAEDKNTDFLTELLPWSKSLSEHIQKPKKAAEK